MQVRPWCAPALILALVCGVASAGLALAACTQKPAESAAAAVPPFDASRAWRDLGRLVGIGPRPSGMPGAEATRKYLENELTAAGLAPVREKFRENTPAGPIDFANVYVDLAPSAGSGASGSAAGTPWVILCTHYDTKRLPGNFVGANDAGSGTAVLLELARALATRKDRPIGYRILFLDGEEAVNHEWRDPDNRYGSRHHAAKLVETRRVQDFKACVLLDMVGDKDLFVLQEGYSDGALYAYFLNAARELGLSKHFASRRGPEILDDHLSFMKVGIRSVDLIDFDYGPGNSYWHTTEDKLEHCSMESLDVIGRVVLRALPALEKSLVAR